MPPLTRSHAFYAWIVLVVVTLASWFLTEETDAAHLGATLVVLIAGVKATLVISHFMEVGWRPAPLRLILTVWTVAVMALIIGGYWAVTLA
jgi:hypothetical protein